MKTKNWELKWVSHYSITYVQRLDEEDNKNMEPDYGDQFEDKK